MVLLTSGQVSVAISSFIVFLFTSALFLSGYVLQQKTVKDIREAIKPQIAPLKTDLYLPPQFRADEFWDGKEEVIVVESNTAGQQVDNNENEDVGHEGENNDDSMVGATRWQKAAKEKERLKLKNEAGAQKPLAERQKGPAGKVPKGDGSKREAEEKPLSRAERRRKIKEEIIAAGEGEGFKGYKRRTW